MDPSPFLTALLSWNAEAVTGAAEMDEAISAQRRVCTSMYDTELGRRNQARGRSMRVLVGCAPYLISIRALPC